MYTLANGHVSLIYILEEAVPMPSHNPYLRTWSAAKQAGQTNAYLTPCLSSSAEESKHVFVFLPVKKSLFSPRRVALYSLAHSGKYHFFPTRWPKKLEEIVTINHGFFFSSIQLFETTTSGLREEVRGLYICFSLFFSNISPQVSRKYLAGNRS